MEEEEEVVEEEEKAESTSHLGDGRRSRGGEKGAKGGGEM